MFAPSSLQNQKNTHNPSDIPTVSVQEVIKDNHVKDRHII